jgi:uncharacterized repeat protein (TIGR01451 family)
LRFDITFDPASAAGPFTNQAMVWSAGEESGIDLDVFSSAVITLPLRPEIEFKKTAGTVVNNQNGTYTVPIMLDLLNVGKEEIVKLQLKDDLDIFGLGTVTDVGTVEVIAGNLTLNENFDGIDDVRLLTGVDSVPIGGKATVRFPLTFDPAGEPGPFTNWAIAWTEGKDSAIGIDVGARDIIALPPDPGIQLQNDAGEVSENADGSLSVPITLTVTNTGDEALRYLQLTDILDFFGSGELLDVKNISSDELTVNEDYDGDQMQTLLMGMDTLPIDAVATVTFSVKFNRGDEPGPLINTATADAVGEMSALPVSDKDDASIELPVIPPPPPPSDFTVTKAADRRYVMRGGLVGYDIIVTNLGDAPIIGFAIVDAPPAGFYFVADSALLIRAGPDGRTGSSDDVSVSITTIGSDPIEFELFDLDPHESVIIRYLMRVGTGVTNGEHFNTLNVMPPLDPGVPVRAPVIVIDDPIFEKSTVIGKVFDDRNGDGWQDENEPGIPGVRLATVSGLSVETDAFGRYHIADVDVERFERGANFIVKIDPYSLPEDAEFISENPRVIRLTQATMSKVNFAVQLRSRKRAFCVESCVVGNQRPEQYEIFHEMCIGAPAFTPGLLEGPLSPSVDNPLRTSCTQPYVDVNNTATSRQVTVSGGGFECGTIVTEILPGRQSDGEPDVDSEVTVFTRNAYAAAAGTGVCPPGIRPGEYPVQVHTDRGSVLWITYAGDVIRKGDPDNAEHIIVTPFRDDTTNTVISALRIANDGSDPSLAGGTNLPRLESWSRQAMVTADPFIVDPRMDVLALNEAVVNDQHHLVDHVSFGTYTNYAANIKAYALEIYGSSVHGFTKTLLDVRRYPTYDFETPVKYGGKTNCEIEARFECTPEGQGVSRMRNLASFTELEYVLKASDCPYPEASGEDDPFDERRCNVDITAVRLIALRAGDSGAVVLHHKNEIWGKTNLAEQNILVEGGRVRISDVANPHSSGVLSDSAIVPVGKYGIHVSEKIVSPGAHRISAGPPRVDGDSVALFSFAADARDITVDGGVFGCGKVLIESLPGRSRDDMSARIPAVTVVADPAARGAATKACPDGIVAGQYPIRIHTFEGTVIHVNSAGDVIPIRPPSDESSRQRIVVTPFRDDADSAVVSALRISNEGFPTQYDISTPVIEPGFDMEAHAFFMVALANLTVGQNNLSGNILPLAADDHFDGTTFLDGRIALYAKGKIQGKYLITAQLDSTEGELKDIADNLRRKDPRRVFRQLDPDHYYPVFGDDSTTTTDVDTQGALYVRVDWNKNTALWGNYNTGMTGTELLQYNRSLYGARFEHESQQTTKFGDPISALTVFASEAQSVSAHVTFQATGGSLYYLRNVDIVQGSEKLWVEVRRRDTEQVVEREILLEGRDYEIDPLQGRIILRRPLSQVVNDRANSIIRSAPLEGNDVYLLVDYEYVPDSFEADETVYGGLVRTWLGDHVAIGATTVTDGTNNAGYKLNGIDLTLKRSDSTYLRAELAHSEARQNDANFTSADGGLTFISQISAAPAASLDGSAFALDARVDLADFNTRLQGDIRAWWKTREADFSTGRLGQGVDVNDGGVELHTLVGENILVSATYTDLDREQMSRERVARVQLEGKFDNLTAGIEIRHEKIEWQAALPPVPLSGLNISSGSGEALLVGARVGYSFSDDTTIYGAAQIVADDRGLYKENDLVTAGISTKLKQDVAVSLEVSEGDRGSALTAGFDLTNESGLGFNVSGGLGSGAVSQFSSRYLVADGHELYGSYAVDPDRTLGARNLLTLGQRRSFGTTTTLFTESQFGKDDRYANVAHVFGLNFSGTDDWQFSASLQFSENDNLGLSFDRRALSLGAYRSQTDLKLSSRLEYREDDGVGVHNRQYMTSNSFTWLVSESSRWLGKLNLSWTDDALNGGRDARFVELGIGHTYRPVNNDKFNLIAKYSFLYDLPARSQDTVRPDERSHLLSIEGIYDFPGRWELAAKAAIRKGERRLTRDSGPWEEFGLRLVSARARYHINNEWDGLAEYRWLSDFSGADERQGALLALYRNVSQHFKVGVGFNFTDFDERLRIDNYENRGWFVDFIGKY